MTKSKLLIVAGVLFVVAVVLMALPRFGEPELECAPKGGATSGFESDELGCPISIESFNEYTEWESGPIWTRIGGLALVVVAGGVAVTAVVKGRRDKKKAGERVDAPAQG